MVDTDLTVERPGKLFLLSVTQWFLKL